MSNFWTILQGGFLTVGDGIIPMEGLELGLSTFNPSFQSEEKHQQCVSPNLLQCSQYLPRKFVSCFTSLSKSMWVIATVYAGSVKICGGYPNPWPVGISVSEVLFSGCTLAALWDVLPFLDFILTPLGLFSCVVLLCPGLGVLIHGEFSPYGLYFDLLSRAPLGILQNRYPFWSQVALSDLLNAILKVKF